MIPKLAEIARASATGANNWREIIPSGMDSACADGFALECLIDLQRAQAMRSTDEN